jgi:hypothetical protein
MQLPEADEPLVLADGTKIDPATGKVIRDNVSQMFAVPSPSEAQRLVVRARKSVAELPMPPKQLSGVALVAFYTLFGLPDAEISIALDNRLTIEQIKLIRKSDAYIDFMAAAKTNIVETETAVVREVFQQHAKGAAEKIVRIAANNDDDSVLAFKAAQDILDRAGHRPADIIEHRHTMEDALQIVITKRDETTPLPVIEGDIINE